MTHAQFVNALFEKENDEDEGCAECGRGPGAYCKECAEELGGEGE